MTLLPWNASAFTWSETVTMLPPIWRVTLTIAAGCPLPVIRVLRSSILPQSLHFAQLHRALRIISDHVYQSLQDLNCDLRGSKLIAAIETADAQDAVRGAQTVRQIGQRK
jgi:hypothetical protein